jgi:hypothetical protein
VPRSATPHRRPPISTLAAHFSGLDPFPGSLRQALRRPLAIGAVALTAALAAAAPLMPTWPGQRYLAFYLAPLVLAVLLWARQRMADPRAFRGWPLVVDGVVFVLSAVRTVGVLPFSGHVLFLVHTLLTARGRGAWSYQLLAALLLASTTWFKLGIWRDFTSWSLGIAAGLASTALDLAARRSTAPTEAPFPASP